MPPPSAPPLPVNVSLLVIGYGNTLREDDGAGPRVAARIEALAVPGVSVLICDQLSPEHAAVVARARVVVFVDAALGGPQPVHLVPLTPSEHPEPLVHALEPGTVLALARDLYERSPQAWLLTIPAVHLSFGEALSPAAATGVDRAVDELVRTFALPRTGT